MEPEHETMSLQIFTDGASSPDGRAGWAYVVVKDDIEILRGQGSALGMTHQRMEIRAVAEALLAAPKDVPVKVVGDSAYVIDCFRYEWHVKWETNGWRTYSKKPVANRDEWERLFSAWRAREAETAWERIKGHNGHRWNEIVDALAVEAKGHRSGVKEPERATDRHEAVRKIATRQGKWDEEVTAQLPKLLQGLLRSPIYGADPPRPKPPEAYGIYLFSEDGKPRYVGRVGLTERSRLAGKRFSNFRTRLNGHTRRPRHTEATYAYHRTCESRRRKGLPLAATRAANCEDPDFLAEFRRQVERVRAMDFQVVEINDNRLAAVFEVYAATVLGLRQSFAVS